MELLYPSFQIFFVFILFVPLVLFLLTQYTTLKCIHPDNRSLAPGAVWLQLIPLFGLVWQFIVVTRIADSLEREFSFRENTFSFEHPSDEPAYTSDSKPTYGIGLS